MKLLIIEDELSLSEMMSAALRKEGYVVEAASTYAAAIERLGVYSYDCVLLDITLPDGNGLDILEEIKRSGSRVNVIITSARDSIDDKIRGLELGADDYLAKPFHLAELVARIRSVTRRSRNSGELAYTAGNVSLFESSRRLTVDGKDVALLKPLSWPAVMVMNTKITPVQPFFREIISFGVTGNKAVAMSLKCCGVQALM